jgi:hypothetical protein
MMEILLKTSDGKVALIIRGDEVGLEYLSIS